jgi:selenocysteine lyase/cysteine desulfurase
VQPSLSALAEEPLDVARLRRETPGCAEVAHLNNAGAALMPEPVLAALRAQVDLEARVGGYEAERRRPDALDRVRESLARLVGGAAGEIALLESASRAWQAFLGALDLGPGDRVLVGRAEYASNVVPLLQLARRRGVEVGVVPDDADGVMDVDALAGMLDRRVRLVSAVHVPTNGGLVNPVAQVGALLRGRGIPYLVDAAQSAGQLPLDVAAIGCDALMAPGRKFLRGPRGTAFLWVRGELADRLEPAMLDGHGGRWSGEREYEVAPGALRFETWEASRAAQLALGAAADYALALGVEALWTRIRELGGELRERLRALPRVTLHDRGRELCGIVTFSVAGHPAAAVREALGREGVNVWVSEAESARLSMAPRGLEAIVRASVHAYNDDSDLDRLIAGIERLP